MATVITLLSIIAVIYGGLIKWVQYDTAKQFRSPAPKKLDIVIDEIMSFDVSIN